ncbi:MAG: GNAT family N-acetyltransferase, partial [Candidatus Magasanikbacteria bacterium]|nr:GNAT family N-acetyltransferase [Candidatus Magasanikbacteria bacterium]
ISMIKIFLRKIRQEDKKYFAIWWRDKELLALTSGIPKRISDREVEKYFREILRSNKDHHCMITANGKTIGHLSLAKRQSNWYETQIVIGEKKYRGKGYGSHAIRSLIKKAKRLGIFRIYLEVRPTNMRAIRAYEHCGFRKARAIPYPKNKYLPETVRMELRN